MPSTRPALRASTPILAMLALAGCTGIGGGWPGSSAAPETTQTATPQPSAPAAAPVNLAGRWMLSSPGRGQCPMTFGATGPAATEGTIAPAGGCPGKFFTSRKWTYDQGGLTIRDHKNQPLAQLSSEDASFQGKATSGEPVTLTR
jgi:hypothetical protein